ncbi:8-oxo-dGTP diphosphatase [Candidatus Planktophila vernalis]|uniref:8-oxo-dGTP diphosphatase n=1 Tax=Candidatus Planktophila vernalis TaxID=1884907 RepID=A0A249KTJ4_9ACTN|nr:NUDIX hydrolase [Candidatus Planktophila vernalis]ASY20132.1 8-oxo-dGTP diphosphatase [Candidatus Planktophila vernalis]
MSARDGDGWIQCACGNKHWGLNGAAGILLVRGTQILLQHRAPWVHNGDTWGIPGGARDSHESVLEAAIREAKEETGIDPVHLTPIQTFSDDHGSWCYDTVIAHASDDLVAHELNDESHEVRWVEIEKVEELTLHPSFEKSWPTLKGLVQAL